MSWRGLDHRTIYAMVVDGGQGAGVSDAAQQAWSNAQRVISDAEHTIAADYGWSGTPRTSRGWHRRRCRAKISHSTTPSRENQSHDASSRC